MTGTPSAASFALVLPGGHAQAMGTRSMGQLSEPSADPDDPRRFLQALLGVESDSPSHGRTEQEPC